MSRRLPLLAAALGLGGLIALASPASAAVPAVGPAVAAAVADMDGTVVQVDGVARRRGAARRAPARRSASARPMRGGRMAAAPRSGSDAAYMGGGAIFERGADGSLRPVN